MHKLLKFFNITTKAPPRHHVKLKPTFLQRMMSSFYGPSLACAGSCRARDTRQCYYVLFWPFSVQWLVPSPGNNQIVSSLRYTNTRHTRLTFSMLIEYSWHRSSRYYLNSFHYTVKLQPNPQANYCLIPTDFLPPSLVVCQMKLNWSILSLSYLLIIQYAFIVYTDDIIFILDTIFYLCPT